MPPVPPQKADYPKITSPPETVDNPRLVDSLYCVYVVSVLAACNAEFVTYPLDLIKTRLQIQGEAASKETKLTRAPYRGAFRTAIGIVQEEGVTKLWQGMPAACLRHVFYSGIRIIAYKQIKEKVLWNENEPYFPLYKSAACGITAGVIAQFVANPADLVKVHLQMEGKRRLLGLPSRVDGLPDAFRKVWRTGGIVGLWKGSVPNMQRAAFVNLGDLTTYDMAKRFLLRNTTLPDGFIVHTMASFCAGFMGAVMGTPADTVKTRVMNQPFDEQGRGLLYKNTWDCFRKTITGEGIFAIYKGFIPLWIRLGPWAIVFWVSFEQTMLLLKADTF